MPLSRLTRERPDIWVRALALASSVTGLEYPHKGNGVLWACGGVTQKDWDVINNQQPTTVVIPPSLIPPPTERVNRRIEERRKKERRQLSAHVPEGEMEWLLHEVGHWIAATEMERALPNYGYGQLVTGKTGTLREWQAWGFEEIVLAPFGPARTFASPTQRDTVMFRQSGPIPEFATRHAARQMRALGVDPQPWRAIYGEWVHWNAGQRDTLH